MRAKIRIARVKEFGTAMSRKTTPQIIFRNLTIVVLSVTHFAIGCGKPDEVKSPSGHLADERPLDTLNRGEIKKCWILISTDNGLDEDVTTWYEVSQGKSLKALVEARFQNAERDSGGVKFSFGEMRVEWMDGTSHSFTMCPKNIYDHVSKCYWTVDTEPLRQFLKERVNQRSPETREKKRG